MIGFKKFPFYRQLEAMDCGPACLRMIFKYYHKEVKLETLRSKSQINTNGVSLLGLSEAAESYGFRATAVRLTFDQLVTDIHLPCIVHWNQSHFVVVTPNVSKKRITIADPSSGLVTLKRDDFVKLWMGAESGKGIALLLICDLNFSNSNELENDKISWLIITKYLSTYRPQIFQLFLGLFLGSILQLIFPFLTQAVVDNGIGVQDLTFIEIILAAQFVLFFARTVIEFIRGRILLFISTHLSLTILSEFWIKLMKLPLSFFDSKQAGDTLQRINDYRRIDNFISNIALQALFSVLTFAIFSIVLLAYNLQIFLIFIVGTFIYFFWISVFLRIRRDLDYKKFVLASKENSASMQLVFGMQEIKLNNAERLRRWEWEDIQAQFFKLNVKSLSINQYQVAGAVFVNEGKNILITYLAASLAVSGEITIGSMLAIQYIIGQLNGPVEQLIAFSQNAQDAKISIDRLNEIQSFPEEEPANNEFVNSLPSMKHINFSNLTFSFLGAGNEPVLRDINLEIPEGKVTAIVGASGSGKTTLLKLLLKYYDNYRGEIRIGETNLKWLSPRLWRQACGCVMQDGYIFSDSIAKNIAVNEQYPDHKKLIHACSVANILNFVESLPLGFNTKIGAEGKGISAGQRQRILIARAVYKNPSFLFFDEATNSLDSTNESLIMDNLNRFFKGKTVVVVAHRLSTIRNADRIIVIDNGYVIENGTHSELISTPSRYSQLVSSQLE